MEDFAAKVIAAHQAGLAERRQQQQLEQQAEEHKLNVQAHKLNLDAAKLQQAQVERQIQALSSGGPTGQATATIQSPTVQPANIPTDVQPPQMAPGLPQTIQDLITRTRAPLPQMQPIPSGQDTSLNGSVPTGLPPAGPDIPVQLSDGRTITLPGTNLETEQARAMQQAIQGLKLKALEPFSVGPDTIRVNPLEGTSISNKKEKDLPALIQEVASVTPGYAQMTGPQQLQAIAAYNKAVKPPATDTFQELDLSSYLKHPELTSLYGADQTGYDKWKQAMEIAKGKANKSESTILIQTTDAAGNPIQKIVPKTAGSEFAAKETTQEVNRSKQADIITREADRILAMIDKTPNAIGPIMGRLARGETVVGTVAPEAKALATALGSFEALQPILHGFRGGSQTVGHFHDVLGDQHLNAAALKASINEIKALAANIKGGKAEEAPAAGFRIVK